MSTAPTVLPLPEVLGFAQVRPILALLDGALREAGPTLTIDLAALRQFDSSALALLLEGRRRALKAGKTLALQGRSPRLEALARLYGIEPLLFPA